MYRDIMLTVMNRKASHAKDVSLETGKLFLEETGYEKRQTSMIKTTMLQFMLEAP